MAQKTFVSNLWEFYLETDSGDCIEGTVKADNFKNAIKKVKKDYKKYSIRYLDVQAA
jgi:hypothetical protein